jgi:bifunctional DNA-binding transcriptional regulator/antitoxin component of YhaV-PrlF toxin-antitoxin module
MHSRISSEGQVTVRLEARERPGLLPGTAVEFIVRDAELVLRKGSRGPDPVDPLYGRLALDRSVDGLLDEMRGPRPTAKPPRKPRRPRR